MRYFLFVARHAVPLHLQSFLLTHLSISCHLSFLRLRCLGPYNVWARYWEIDAHVLSRSIRPSPTTMLSCHPMTQTMLAWRHRLPRRVPRRPSCKSATTDMKNLLLCRRIKYRKLKLVTTLRAKWQMTWDGCQLSPHATQCLLRTQVTVGSLQLSLHEF